MAGFAAAIGGAGNAALQYGGQMRQILEQRREGIANLFTQRAQEESDPTMRQQWLQGATDTLAGKDFGKILPALIKAHDTHAQNTQALGQAAQQIAGPQQPAPPPPPGPAPPGQTPGMLPGLQGIPGNEDISMAQPQGGIAAQIAGPPAAPPAAQPAGNPLTSVSGPIQAPGTPPPAPTAAIAPGLRGGGAAENPLLPLPQSVAPPAINGGGVPGLPTPENPADIYRDVMNRTAPGGTVPLWNAPANRPALQAELTQRLQHQEALRQALESQQATLAYKRAAVEQVLKENPNLPDVLKADLRAQAGGLQGFQPSALIRPMNQPGIMPADQVPDDQRFDIYGKPISAKDSPFIREHYDLIHGIYYSPATGPEMNIAGPNGLEVAPRLPGAVTATGGAPALPVSALTPRATGVSPTTGQTVYQSPYSLFPQGGAPSVLGAGVNPTFVQSRSSTTTQIPGQPPTTSTVIRTKGGAGATAADGSAKSPPSSTAPPAPPAVDPLAARNYDDWANGRRKLTPAEEKGATLYAVQHNLPTPIELSPSGQNALKDIDPVLQEVQRTKAQLQDAIKKGLGKTDMAAAYARYHYRLGNTPYDNLIANLSFSGLRSAATAMKGTGSRALPVLSRALEHTPVLSINPDDPKTMLDKLGEMETRLTEGRNAILQEERKGGVIQPLPGAGAPAIQGLPGAKPPLASFER